MGFTGMPHDESDFQYTSVLKMFAKVPSNSHEFLSSPQYCCTNFQFNYIACAIILKNTFTSRGIFIKGSPHGFQSFYNQFRLVRFLLGCISGTKLIKTVGKSPKYLWNVFPKNLHGNQSSTADQRTRT